MSYFLTTHRLGFRQWRRADLPLAQKLWGDHRVTRLFDARGPLSPEVVAQKLAVEMLRLSQHGIQYWPLFLLEDHQFVGVCGLRPYGDDPTIFETGFHLIPEHWRKGLAQEAAAAVFDRAFNHHGATALVAGHNPQNEASQRTLTRLGFRYTHHEYYAPMDAQHPLYRLTPEDWQAAKANRSRSQS